ncbi:MAG: hypothetical protein LBL99_01380 [Holosporaceae bacterium]|jgi:hypothetical protein|nr:hypothetical protein [Holosporaceae bacterium]
MKIKRIILSAALIAGAYEIANCMQPSEKETARQATLKTTPFAMFLGNPIPVPGGEPLIFNWSPYPGKVKPFILIPVAEGRDATSWQITFAQELSLQNNSIPYRTVTVSPVVPGMPPRSLGRGDVGWGCGKGY